ncbi:hypothetical protein V4C53_17535 [Paraburkholderia azotifigens]|uniref:hypothetical protein n=1 Tax=Paraburkholderia azotifigens TaxID=2057004 RepID=UPI0031803989
MTHAIRLDKSSIRAQRDEGHMSQSKDRAAVHQERAVSEELWCVHIEGLDDFVATISREAAEREASAINAHLDSLKDKREERAPTRMVRASAAVWPYTAEGHARSLETDWEDLQRMPHRQVKQNPDGGTLSFVLRWMKALVRSVSRKG